jgi:hypothetical protein
MQSGRISQHYLIKNFPWNLYPLDFQSWQSCYTANFYWIIKGGEFDACGYYVSFQNGEWILREEQCIRYFRGILK